MSQLVILEGSLIQKTKNKDSSDVYVVLTQSCLRLYRSHIAYQQNPNNPIRIMDFDNQYHLLPMSFDTAFRFSIFKRGEKADDRLYLEATTKSEYEMWLGQIDAIISRKPEPEGVSTTKTSSTDAHPQEPVPSGQNNSSTDQADKGPSPKAPASTRYNIKTNPATADTKQATDKPKVDLKTEKQDKTVVPKEKEQLPEIQAVTNKKLIALEKEKATLEFKVKDLNKQISLLNQSITKNHEYSNQQLDTASSYISRSLTSPKIDCSSYKHLVNYLCADESQTNTLNSFLRHQLEHLIHKLPLEDGSQLSLFRYLTESIKMSEGSMTRFISTFLISLSKQINPTASTKCDLISNISTLISSVVKNVPSSQSLSSNKCFQQTAIEIAYLVNPAILDHNQLSNGFSNSADINDQFDDVLRLSNVESVSKVFIIELSKALVDKDGGRESDNGRIEHNTVKENHVNGHFDGLWINMHRQLEIMKRDNDDLLIVINQLSATNQALEAERIKHDDWRDMDKLINYYTSISKKLCDTCQLNVVNMLKSPVTEMVDKFVDDFVSYWKSLNDMTASLAKKKIISVDVKDSIDMIKKSTAKFELLVPQLQDITQRTINNPGCSKPVQNTNEQ